MIILNFLNIRRLDADKEVGYGLYHINDKNEQHLEVRASTIEGFKQCIIHYFGANNSSSRYIPITQLEDLLLSVEDLKSSEKIEFLVNTKNIHPGDSNPIWENEHTYIIKRVK